MRGRVLVVLGLTGLVVLGTTYPLDLLAERRRPRVEPWSLALPDLATTVALARVPEGVLVLREVDEREVKGVLVGGDPLSLYASLGLDGLRASRDAGPLVSRPLDGLLPPIETPPPHIGAGNNFADHQEEVGLHDSPELFPKMSAPTAWDADVPHRGRLDYEVELCGVTLTTARRDQTPPLGFVLCNDFTDRWAMLASLDPRAPLGTTGFSDGKGAPGFLPTGPWLVVAEDPGGFAAAVDLRLSVDGRLRQDAAQSDAIWDHARLLRSAWERCEWDFRYGGEAVAWPACDEIPAGTLILGGTPGGVVFRMWNIWAWWEYLAPGDVVFAEGTGLGRIESRVVSPRDGASQR